MHLVVVLISQESHILVVMFIWLQLLCFRVTLSKWDRGQ